MTDSHSSGHNRRGARVWTSQVIFIGSKKHNLQPFWELRQTDRQAKSFLDSDTCKKGLSQSSQTTLDTLEQPAQYVYRSSWLVNFERTSKGCSKSGKIVTYFWKSVQFPLLGSDELACVQVCEASLKLILYKSQDHDCLGMLIIVQRQQGLWNSFYF